MSFSLVQEKGQRFSIRIAKMFKYLQSKKEFTISKQVLRSGTSIGANISEALNGESTADFIHKMSIALKEAGETAHWLITLHKSGDLNNVEFDSIYPDCVELIKMLTSIVKTSKENEKKKNSKNR